MPLKLGDSHGTVHPMGQRIIRGVRVATPRGIEPAAVFLEGGRITYVAGYEDIAREAKPEELGKSILMPGLILAESAPGKEAEDAALLGGVTSFGEGTTCIRSVSELSRVLPARWTHSRDRDERLELLIRQTITEPAKACGLAETKGSIAKGFDADLVIWNPEYSIAGTQPLLYGLVRQVIVAGETRVREGVLQAS